MKQLKKYKKILNKTVKSIGDCTDHLYKEGWAEAGSGNLSIDVSNSIPGKKIKNEQWLLITRSGCRFRETARRPWNDVLLIRTGSKKGIRIEYSGKKNARPTSELPTHKLIHDFYRKKKTRGTAVIHTHPTYIIALTHLKDYRQTDILNRLLVSIHPEIKAFIPEGVGFVPYLPPGSERIAVATQNAIEKHRVIIWEKHGCIAVADDLDRALDLIMIMEKAARIFFIARSAGFDLQELSQQQVDDLTNIKKR